MPIALAREAERKGKSFKGTSWHHYLLLYVLAPPIFLYKKTRVGDCIFKIDKDGIRRDSKTGVKVIEWGTIKDIHKLSSTYLIELNQGALPIPFRCFKSDEQDLFLSYIASEKPNKFKNENAVSGSDASSTRPF